MRKTATCGRRASVASTHPAISAAGLAKRFGNRPVLRGLDLELGWGSVLTLFGPNGAGKTTLLRTLAGLTRHSGGALRIAGRDVADRRADARHLVGVVMHQTFLYDDLTVAENLRFYARMYGLGATAAERAASAADALGLDAVMNARVRTLSNGMQKRAALARAVLHRPPLLLLDEPETGLDQDAMLALEQLLARHREAGGSAIVTTHGVEQGLRIANRAAIIHNGRIAYDAPRRCLGRRRLPPPLRRAHGGVAVSGPREVLDE